MSLINNALKQAEQVRPKEPTPTHDTEYFILNPPPRSTRGSSLPLTALMVAALLLSGFMTWKWFRTGSGEMKVRAHSYASAVNPVSQPQPAIAETKSVVPETNAIVEERAVTETTNKVKVAAELPKPAPVTYKLQGIVYVPGRSSAVINGKTVVTGEHVAEAQVVKIDKDTVTIVTAAGQTNLLDLF